MTNIMHLGYCFRVTLTPFDSAGHDRRSAVRLIGMSIAAALFRCAKSDAAPHQDFFFHARPRPDAATSQVTKHPQRLAMGVERDGYFHVPRAERAPLLLYLHGATASGARAMERLTEFAESTGTIVLAPDSRGETWGVVAGDESADIAFIDRALEKIFRTCAVDPHRIAVAGFSDGATAALSWGLINGNLFSAIGAFSPGFIRLATRPRGTPRVFVSHGREDTILPIDRCGRRIAQNLETAGYRVKYREFDGDHTVPPEIRSEGLSWILE
jgi:phospholipase/carboxylesterase